MIPSTLREATQAVLARAAGTRWVARDAHPGRGYGRRPVLEAAADSAFAFPYGCLNAVHWHALKARRYLSEYGADHAALTDLVVNSRFNANRNDHAIFSDRRLTTNEYQAARSYPTR